MLDRLDLDTEKPSEEELAKKFGYEEDYYKGATYVLFITSTIYSNDVSDGVRLFRFYSKMFFAFGVRWGISAPCIFLTLCSPWMFSLCLCNVTFTQQLTPRHH